MACGNYLTRSNRLIQDGGKVMSQVVTDEKIIQLEKMHVLQIKISLEIKRICEKHNISYFIMAGTVLGAVRHGGFIPWDDDLDIFMDRKNYLKFIECCLQIIRK